MDLLDSEKAVPFRDLGKDERDFIQRAQAGDERARQEVITRNLRAVWKITKFYNFGVLSAADLFDAGVEGLMIALNSFDGVNFSNTFMSYAVNWIRQSMISALNNDARLIKFKNIPKKKLLQKIEKYKQKHYAKYGFYPDDHDLIFGFVEHTILNKLRQEKQVGLDFFHKLFLSKSHFILFAERSLNTLEESHRDNTKNIIDLDKPGEGGDAFLHEKISLEMEEEQFKDLLEYLDLIPVEDKEFLFKIFGIRDNSEYSSLKELSKDLGLSVFKIKKRQAAIFGKLRRLMGIDVHEDNSILGEQATDYDTHPFAKPCFLDEKKVQEFLLNKIFPQHTFSDSIDYEIDLIPKLLILLSGSEQKGLIYRLFQEKYYQYGKVNKSNVNSYYFNAIKSIKKQLEFLAGVTFLERQNHV